MKIFLTGSSSFVGKELLRCCAAKNIEVVGVDAVYPEQKGCYQADICSESVSRHIPSDCDAMIHLAALSRDADCKGNAYKCFTTNVMGTLNMIEAAASKGVKQFIFASSEWVYGDFKEGEIKNEDSFIDASSLKSEYALSKLVSEINLRQRYSQGFCPVTILRFGIIYGPREGNWSAVESLLNLVATQPEVAVGSLQTGRCFIHVTDIAEAIIASIGLGGFQIINVQGKNLVTLSDIIEAAKMILKRDPKVQERTPGQVSQRIVSNAKAKELLHWQARIGLEEGLRTVADFLKIQ